MRVPFEQETAPKSVRKGFLSDNMFKPIMLRLSMKKGKKVSITRRPSRGNWLGPAARSTAVWRSAAVSSTSSAFNLKFNLISKRRNLCYKSYLTNRKILHVLHRLENFKIEMSMRRRIKSSKAWGLKRGASVSDRCTAAGQHDGRVTSIHLLRWTFIV